MTEEEYLEMEDSYIGFCTNCSEWTRHQTEPDATDYDCPQCDNNTVVGAMIALMDDLVPIV